MTDPYAGSPAAEDIDDDTTPSARLDREADRIIAEADAASEDRSFGPTPTVSAVIVEDVVFFDEPDQARPGVRERAERVREVIREEPMRATLYALGAGLLLGMLLRR